MNSPVADRLTAAGMSVPEARKKSELFAKIERQLAAESGASKYWASTPITRADEVSSAVLSGDSAWRRLRVRIRRFASVM